MLPGYSRTHRVLHAWPSDRYCCYCPDSYSFYSYREFREARLVTPQPCLLNPEFYKFGGEGTSLATGRQLSVIDCQGNYNAHLRFAHLPLISRRETCRLRTIRLYCTSSRTFRHVLEVSHQPPTKATSLDPRRRFLCFIPLPQP